jgi:hypothetical protein
MVMQGENSPEILQIPIDKRSSQQGGFVPGL